MNPQSQDACLTAQQLPILSDLIVTIKNQQGQLNAIMKDMYGFVESVKSIGMKLDSVSHPDSVPKEGKSPGGNGLCCPEKNPTDGFVNELERIIDFNTSFISEFNNRIYDQFRKNMAYIETHI